MHTCVHVHTHSHTDIKKINLPIQILLSDNYKNYKKEVEALYYPRSEADLHLCFCRYAKSQVSFISFRHITRLKCFFGLMLNVQVNNFSVIGHIGMEPPLPGYYQYFFFLFFLGGGGGGGGKYVLLKDNKATQVGLKPRHLDPESEACTTRPTRPHNECALIG